MSKQNCWEFMQCGKRDSCPVAKESSAHGLNGGVNGGRICWVIMSNASAEETACLSECCGSRCYQCTFRSMVMNDEGVINVCCATGIFINKDSKKSSPNPE